MQNLRAAVTRQIRYTLHYCCVSILFSAVFHCACQDALAAEPVVSPPALLLANVYQPGIVLSDYWVSEKYDGVRAYWDGRQLFTRGGEPVQAPAWFTAGWPVQPLDGELWSGRGQFAATLSTVRRQTPSDAAWRRVRFMVFDLPAHTGSFDQRLPALHSLLRALNISWLQPVPQYKVADHAALQAMLDATVAHGGEGLMLHRGASRYRGERSDDLLKFKPYQDAEAVVVGHTPGKGKYAGQLGALLVEMPNGVRFRLGSGLSDQERRQPPPVGSVVTYRYRGFHASGIPRFAVFMRIREAGW